MKKIAFISFGKKPEKLPNEVPPPAGPEDAPLDNANFDPTAGVPIDLIVSMKNQGMTPDQIVQALQRQGFDPHQIYDAMNQVSIKTGVENVPPEYFSPGEYPQQQQPIQPQGFHQSTEKIEEVTQAIVDEKWKDLSRTIEKIMEWKDRVENRLAALEQDISNLKSNYNDLHQGVLGKIGEYDKNITDLGVEIKAMEKVFKEVLPTLTDNINELSEITKELRSK